MAVGSISSSSSLKDIQQSTVKNKNSSSDKSESVTTSKYDKYVESKDSEDAGIYSSKTDKESDGYRYRTRQEKKELKEKKSKAFSFGGIFNISAASVFERLLGNKNQQ